MRIANLLRIAIPGCGHHWSTCFPEGLRNSDGEPVRDLLDECCSRDIDGNPCFARWVECPDREHRCNYMDRNNPVWREYLKAVIRIQIGAGVDGAQLDEASTPITALQYAGCFCKDCVKGFRAHLLNLPAATLPDELEAIDLAAFDYGAWLRQGGHDVRVSGAHTPLFWEYLRDQRRATASACKELAEYLAPTLRPADARFSSRPISSTFLTSISPTNPP